MAELRVAFWNVENMFHPDAGVDRGPNSTVELEAKVRTVAKVCRECFPSGAPHILGLIEVGEQRVFDAICQSLGPTYAGLWVPPGKRTQTGLGIAFDSGRVTDFKLVAVDRPTVGSKPRAIVAECKTSEFNPLVVALTHWKSRMQQGGVDDNADRVESGRWLGELLSTNYDKQTPILVGGDFNAEPYEAPFLETALKTKRHHRSVLHGRATAAYLYNPTWRWLSEPDAYEVTRQPGFQASKSCTTHSDGTPVVFDQIMVSKSLLSGSPISLIESEVAIVPHPRIRGAGAKIFPSKWEYDDVTGVSSGLSDHFPVIARFA